MTLKWNREIILVILMGIMILIGGFYYGNLYLVDPLKQEAEAATSSMETQQNLLANYPPSEDLQQEHEKLYEETEAYLPVGVEINRELVRLESLANRASVEIGSLTRNTDQEPVENLAAEFASSSYTVQATTTAPANFRNLLNALTEEERTWNITSFSYTKTGENNYTGTLNFTLYHRVQEAE